MHKAFLFTLVLLLMLISGGLLGQETPEDKVREGWPNTVSAFGKNSKNVPSHYIFVVDVTEENFGPEISSQIQSFVDALPANDRITIIQLGPTNETIELVPTCKVTKSLKKDILDKLKGIEWGREGSDGLKMADRVIDAMNNPAVSKSIPFVFIFSDFEFYIPLPGNRFKVPPLKEWEKLNSKFKNVAKGLRRADRLNINGLRLNNPNQKSDYFDKLQVVFGEISLSTVSGANLLKEQFSNIQADIYRKRLLDYIMDLVSNQNSNIQLENNNNQITLKGSDTLVYHKVILDNESKNKVSQILKSDKLFSFFPPSETEIDVSGTLVAEKYNKELPELTDIQLKDQKVVLLTADSLIPWWLTDTIALILLLSIWRYIWTIIPPARLRGTIDFSMQGKNTITKDCSGSKQTFSSSEVKYFRSDFLLEIRPTKKMFAGKCLIISPSNGDLVLISTKNKKTARNKKQTIAKVSSTWSIDGIEITMPRVK